MSNAMKSEWRVSINPIGPDEYLYQVYRLRDVDAVDHSGNREIYKAYDTEAEAQQCAQRMNIEEDENE